MRVKELVRQIINLGQNTSEEVFESAVTVLIKTDRAMTLERHQRLDKEVKMIKEVAKKTKTPSKRKYKKKNARKKYTLDEKKILADPSISLKKKYRLIKGRTRLAIKTEHYKLVKKKASTMHKTSPTAKVKNPKRISGVKGKGKRTSSFKRWSKKEEDFLKLDNIPRPEKINQMIARGRTKVATLARMSKLGLLNEETPTVPKLSSEQKWTMTEDAILTGAGSTSYKVKEMKKLGRSESATLRRLRQLNM